MKTKLAGGAVMIGTVLTLGPALVTSEAVAQTPADRIRPAAAEDTRDEPVRLDELLELARERSPEIQAARHRALAAEARVPQAGALPDPSLYAGLMNLPIPDLSLGSEGMTMFSLQLSQRVPVPGSRSLREEVAGALHRASIHEVEALEVQVIAELKAAYHELVFVHEAEQILLQNRALLDDLAAVAEGRLAVGRSPQQDLLRARTEVTRIDELLAANEDRRIAALTEVNRILNRTPLEPIAPEYPQEVRRMALASLPPGAFTTASLAGGIGPGLPSLEELQVEAVRFRPGLLAHFERIRSMELSRELAVRSRWPDLTWMVAYSARSGRRDMVSVGVAMDLPVFRSRKQDQFVVEATELLADHEVRHHEMVARIRAEVASRYSSVVRSRERVLLLMDGVIPQARATVESAAGAYQAGQVEFAGLLEAQATLFRNEIELARLLADFGSELAALEAAVGIEIGSDSSSVGAIDMDGDEEVGR